MNYREGKGLPVDAFLVEIRFLPSISGVSAHFKGSWTDLMYTKLVPTMYQHASGDLMVTMMSKLYFRWGRKKI